MVTFHFSKKFSEQAVPWSGARRLRCALPLCTCRHCLRGLLLDRCTTSRPTLPGPARSRVVHPTSLTPRRLRQDVCRCRSERWFVPYAPRYASAHVRMGKMACLALTLVHAAARSSPPPQRSSPHMPALVCPLTVLLTPSTVSGAVVYSTCGARRERSCAHGAHMACPAFVWLHAATRCPPHLLRPACRPRLPAHFFLPMPCARLSSLTSFSRSECPQETDVLEEA